MKQWKGRARTVHGSSKGKQQQSYRNHSSTDKNKKTGEVVLAMMVVLLCYRQRSAMVREKDHIVSIKRTPKPAVFRIGQVQSILILRAGDGTAHKGCAQRGLESAGALEIACTMPWPPASSSDSSLRSVNARAARS